MPAFSIEPGITSQAQPQSVGDDNMRSQKRKSILPLVAMAVALAAGALISGRAEALPSSLPKGARVAIDTINPIEHAACWRFGWRGWGWYPFCGPRPPAVVFEEGVYDAWPPACRDVTVRERRGPRIVVRHFRRCD
jgi:hypothetical protein